MPERTTAHRRATTLLVTFLLAASAFAQGSDPAGVRDELLHMFDRPSGTPISAEQKQQLAEFVSAHEGEDLGDFGYARALLHYLQRDPAAAAAELDRFLATHDTIPIEEHAAIAGRIYLGALAEASRTGKFDVERDALRAERAARLYPDARMVGVVVGRIEGEQSPAIRLGAVRGMLARGADPEAIDAALSSLYSSGSERQRGPAPRTAQAADAATSERDTLTGKPAPSLDVQHVVNGDAGFSLESARGKVVVLDFFATWCAPCRAVVPELVELQREHGDDVQVIGATRFYGYGMDFAGDDVKLPHGGQRVQDLGREQEIAINRTFADAFDLNYPIVFAGQDVAPDQYRVRGIPTVYVIGRDGNVLGHVVGGGEANHRTILALVERGLSSQSSDGGDDGATHETTPETEKENR